jgi:hypothetical protein
MTPIFSRLATALQDFPPSGYQAFHTAMPAKAGLKSGRLAFHFRMVRSVKANLADAMPMNPTTGSGLAVFFYNPLKTQITEALNVSQGPIRNAV